MSPTMKALLASALTLPLVAFVGGVLAAPDDPEPDRSRPVIIGRMDDDPADDAPAPTPTDEDPDGGTRQPGDDSRDRRQPWRRSRQRRQRRHQQRPTGPGGTSAAS